MAASPSLSSLAYPGHVLALGINDTASVLAIQRRLNQLGCGPVAANGLYAAETFEAVEIFQMRSVDKFEVPLTVDGRVGPMTWAALFGSETAPEVRKAASELQEKTLEAARAEIGVREDPPGSNRGPRVDEFLRSVGLDPGQDSFPWCAAFVYWCFDQAARTLKRQNPVVRTAGVLDHWNKAGARGIPRISTAEVEANPSLVLPGMVFIFANSAGNGHTGLVERVDGVLLTTIEGNTNEGGSREGIGVFRRTARRIPSINRGFLDYR